MWDTILRLLRRGHSVHTAVGEIERVYGEGKTVSIYIILLRHDGRDGHHRDLRYFFLGGGGGGGGKFFPVTDIDSPLSLYLSMFSSPKNTSSFLEIVRNLFTMLILVQWYQMW